MRDQQEVCQSRVTELTRELSKLMSEITKYKKEHGDMSSLRSKLLSTGERGYHGVIYSCPLLHGWHESHRHDTMT